MRSQETSVCLPSKFLPVQPKEGVAVCSRAGSKRPSQKVLQTEATLSSLALLWSLEYTSYILLMMFVCLSSLLSESFVDSGGCLCVPSPLPENSESMNAPLPLLLDSVSQTACCQQQPLSMATCTLRYTFFTYTLIDFYYWGAGVNVGGMALVSF